VRAARVCASPAAPADASTLAQPFAGRCVVVIDDDVAVTAAMAALFGAWGAQVIAAADDAQALRAMQAARRQADLLVVDLRLGEGASGLQAIERLRRVAGAGTPAMVISGDTTDDAVREVAAARIALLHKPVTAAALLAATRNALAPAATACCAAA
jgi:DNA-binding NtrC family response regulator